MGKTTVECPECGNEILIQRPGQKVAAAYVEIGYSNGGAVIDLQQAIEMVDIAAEDLPFRDDLTMAARLLRRVDAQLITVADDWQ